ncbi:hypothetical protein [Streptomyces albireticuli]|uniref:Uncharacterized protein n=1 Tax=Streptomyces albireticuli TaxID=1940 RepID=A0A2A2DEP5_9ACTN|nr:hypothetical protein [Streptomyces albireticuli]MCD9194719.1 hypothetical protein [Streptomyces albireticuli]PAU49926.1 hypothetical protein CK936_05160 [Streptomyces albireticuli]
MIPGTHEGLLFGIYPGGVAGDDAGGLADGPPDAPSRVPSALDRLQGRPGRPFLVRAYTGFDDTTPLFGPATSFVTDLTGRGGKDFVADLDYVGLDFFPDVFRPVAASDLASAVEGLPRHHRDAVLTPAGLGHLPLRITEHGRPTGPERPPHRQAEVVETVVRVIAAQAKPLGLSGYTHFALRDADSAKPGLFHRFGLTTDDYTPKPAFESLRALVDRFSV